MKLTEKEAAQKWCPHIRFGLNVSNIRGVDENKCIASKCMMWRWEGYGFDDPVTKEPLGYCGLARG